MTIQGTSASNEPQVKVQNNERDQKKAVSDTILQGIEETPKPKTNGDNGHRVNIAA